ncbi:unnamed protein product [Prorocentrum cordatum]|uniref:tRNA:m(4)X modification enzyme TRM13 n=1 Tax=Prorocentrum cordatum TaxID=2364126 RepID=A0ABN9W5I4_9DINO|nr:unnamed protein product [Polarella glacialis]
MRPCRSRLEENWVEAARSCSRQGVASRAHVMPDHGVWSELAVAEAGQRSFSKADLVPRARVLALARRLADLDFEVPLAELQASGAPAPVAATEKHVGQECSLVGHVVSSGCLEGADTVLDLGAGRGCLSERLQQAAGTRAGFLLIDRDPQKKGPVQGRGAAAAGEGEAACGRPAARTPGPSARPLRGGDEASVRLRHGLRAAVPAGAGRGQGGAGQNWAADAALLRHLLPPPLHLGALRQPGLRAAARPLGGGLRRCVRALALGHAAGEASGGGAAGRGAGGP